MSAPVAFILQPVTTTTGWWGFGFCAATLVAFAFLSAVALWTPKSSRARSYRTAALMAIGIAPQLAVTALRATDYLDQVTQAWDTTVDIEAAWWDFTAAAWGIIFSGLAIASYIPQADLHAAWDKKRGKHRGGESQPLPASETEFNKSSTDVDKNVNHWTSAAANLLAGAMVTVFGPFALQQAFPRVMWPAFGVAMFSGICIIGTYGLIVYLINRAVHMEVKSLEEAKEKGKKDSKKTRKSVQQRSKILMGSIIVYAFLSIAGVTIAAGISPAVATAESTFTITNSIAVLWASQFSCGAIAFFLSLILDIRRSKYMPEDKETAHEA